MLNQFYVLLIFKLKLKQQHIKRRVLQAFLKIRIINSFINIIESKLLLI